VKKEGNLKEETRNKARQVGDKLVRVTPNACSREILQWLDCLQIDKKLCYQGAEKVLIVQSTHFQVHVKYEESPNTETAPSKSASKKTAANNYSH
jgi:hypothetical protein